MAITETNNIPSPEGQPPPSFPPGAGLVDGLAPASTKDRFKCCFQVITSFLYFIQTWVQIEDKETSRAIPFKLWPSQLEIMPQIVSDAWLIVLKARQLGLTWIIAAYCLWLAITRPMQQILVISYNQDVAQEFVTRIRFMLARLPEWLYPRVVRDTSEFLEFEHKSKDGKPVHSVIQSLPTTPKGGQSKTPTLLVIDESSWNQYFREIYTATEPGIEAAKGRVIIISNAIKTAPGWSFTRELCVRAQQGLNIFKLIFLGWQAHPGRPQEPVQDPVTKEMIPKFIWSQRYEKNKQEEDIIEHYPATIDEAISTLGGSYFGTVLKRHNKTCKGVTGNIKRNKDGEIEWQDDPRGIIEVWRFPYSWVAGWDGHHWARRYCIGADISEGLGESFSVGYVMDRHLDEFIARIRSNRVDAYQWAEHLALLGEWYSNVREWTRIGGTVMDKAVICAEKTGAGQTTVKRLMELKANQYLRLIEGKQGGGHTTEYGWSETQQAKHDLSEDLRTWFRLCSGTVYDATLIDECSTWIKAEGTGRIGPEEGHFGDCVIAAGCTIQASHFLGKSPEKIKPPDTGWMAKQIEKHKEVSGWTV